MDNNKKTKKKVGMPRFERGSKAGFKKDSDHC